MKDKEFAALFLLKQSPITLAGLTVCLGFVVLGILGAPKKALEAVEAKS